MGKDKNSRDEHPKTQQERIDWFVDAPVEDSQELADYHGDATKDRRN